MDIGIKNKKRKKKIAKHFETRQRGWCKYLLRTCHDDGCAADVLEEFPDAERGNGVKSPETDHDVTNHMHS